MEYFTSFSSSNVARIGYDSVTSTLEVSFHNAGAYHYYNVPSHIWDQFKAAASKGTFLHEKIKGRFRYSRI